MTLWLLTAACVVSGSEQSWLIDEAVERVEVDARNGDVDVVARQRHGAAVEWSGGGLGTDVTPELEVRDGVLHVDTLCDGLCGGELTLSIPDYVPVTVVMDTGHASVRLTVPTDVCVELGAGSAEVTLPGGAYAVDLEVGAGSVELDGVWDQADADHTVTGSVGAGSLAVRAL